MTKSAAKRANLPDSLSRSWGWMLGLGILFVILGCLGLGMVVGLTLVSVMFLGLLFVCAGVAQIIDVFQSSQWKGALWHALIAVLYILGGGLIIHDPILASALITALLAWTLIIIGITRFILAYQLREGKEWGWFLLGGITSLVLGILILAQWPLSALWLIGLFIAIELMVNGWSYIFIAFAIRPKSA